MKMGALKLECPLCCNEIFTTALALKYHLLSIIDNLLCTVCGKKFEDVRTLAEHLGSECKVNQTKGDAEDGTSKCSKASDGSEFDEDELQSYGTIDEEMDVEMEGDSSEEPPPVVADPETEPKLLVKEEEEEEEVYFCSTCNIKFNNVETHLEKYHEGEEVLVEDGTENQEATETEGQAMQTIEEEERTDKAGRAYTRKVVQIDKFWVDGKEKDETQEEAELEVELEPEVKAGPPEPDPETEEQESHPEPITQYFSVKGGVASKIDKSQVQTIDENILIVYQCPLCAMHFTKEKMYNQHKCAQPRYTCKVCKANFSQSRSLSAHMRMHKTPPKTPAKPGGVKKAIDGKKRSQSGPFNCDICGTVFNSFKSLRLHLRMHDPVKTREIEPPVNYGIMGEDLEDKQEERQMFTCKICNKEYDEVYKPIHMQSHTAEDNYDCQICNRKFFTESNLEMHMRVHNTEKTHVCTYCKEEFEQVEDLQSHIKQHLETRPYECQYCSRRFIRPHEKVKHERIHTGEKPHICELCGKAFRVSYCLTLHMRTHSGSRPYQCQECGKRFKAHSVYNHHLLIHSNARNYKCPYCPKAFKTAVQLAGHKNTHTKPFTCTECNRPFASLYAVRCHMETHKQENNLKYNCFSCGASYARAFALRDHIKAHHDGEQWETELDGMDENASTTAIIAQEGMLILNEDTLVQTVEMVDENTNDDQ